MAPRRRTTPSYYACPVSRAPGIYTAWEDAKRVVDAYPGAIHKVRRGRTVGGVGVVNERQRAIGFAAAGRIASDDATTMRRRRDDGVGKEGVTKIRFYFSRARAEIRVAG